MTLRAEQIVDAIVTALSVPGLTTTKTRVFRGRVYPLQSSELPGLMVYMGPDTIVNELQTGILDWDLMIGIESYVQTVAEQVDTVANRIRKEVHIAMMADYTQGLGFVLETTPGLAAEPVLSDSNQPVSIQRLEYIIRYRTSRTDLSL